MDWDKQTADEWKKLGFYYLHDNDLKQWWIMGSKSGLTNFSAILLDYSNNPSLTDISEHIHLGPHQYLEIITWKQPIISGHCIGGSLADIGNLKKLMDSKLLVANPGETFEIGADYAPVSEHTIRFFVMADDFDPASIELK